ncbi:hypothetical protein [Rhizobium leguminosarum]|uniref:hypothetical protein n=1 Tax=Rhizobium leguminosarum TaxID=384 RepID=UPI001C910094|nr:hypothetical protein [Rhizobium leguminosarum]MBY2910003.1 hypothetical protein [Rhizobium leguminosarum]MBY3026705.1 hypothetical protein [Rhizobium leguminosarum]
MSHNTPNGGASVITATAVTALSLANAIFIANTKVMLKKGLITSREAQVLVLEVVELVRRSTDTSQSIAFADTLCRDLERFAQDIGGSDG